MLGGAMGLGSAGSGGCSDTESMHQTIDCRHADSLFTLLKRWLVSVSAVFQLIIFSRRLVTTQRMSARVFHQTVHRKGKAFDFAMSYWRTLVASRVSSMCSLQKIKSVCPASMLGLFESVKPLRRRCICSQFTVDEGQPL